MSRAAVPPGAAISQLTKRGCQGLRPTIHKATGEN